MLYSPEQLTPIYLELAGRVASALPPDIAKRLVWSRNAFRHGSKTDVVLFNAWDCEQTGLERNQFKNYESSLRAENLYWRMQTIYGEN